MPSDSLSKFVHHTMSMRRITNVELINTYWTHAPEIVDTGRLAFIVRGNLSWKSERRKGVKGSNGLWLKSNRYEPAGKHIAEKPVRTYLQWYMNIYEIWGTMDISIDLSDASVSKPLIEQAMEKATCVSNTMSLLFGASLRWYPALYRSIRHVPSPTPPECEVTESWDCIPLARSQEEQTSTVIGDENITNGLLPLVNRVESLPSSIQTVIKTSIDWHAQGNHHTSGLNRFLNYWQSIELLGNFFYRQFNANVVHRKLPEEKKHEIMELLSKGVTSKDCMAVIQRCEEIRDPSIRTKTLAFLSVITDRDRMEAELFKPDDKTGKSLYDIRNDIVHGRISEHHFEEKELLSHRLFDIQKISHEIILLSIIDGRKIAGM